MDCRVCDGRIEPLLYRIACDLKAIPIDPETGRPLDPRLEAPTDDAAFLAYSDAERNDIQAGLLAAKIAYNTRREGQPDPTLLAACQGKVGSRSEALAALAAGSAPETTESLAAKVKELDAQVKALAAKVPK